MLTTPGLGQANHQHTGQAAFTAPNFPMCKRKETEAIQHLLFFTAKTGARDSTQACFLQASAGDPKLEADATAS